MAQELYANSWDVVAEKRNWIEAIELKQGVNSPEGNLNFEFTLVTEFADGMTCSEVVNMPYPIARELAEKILKHTKVLLSPK